MTGLLLWTLLCYLVVGGLLVGYSFLAKAPTKPTIAQRVALGLGWLPWTVWILLQKVRDGQLPRL